MTEETDGIAGYLEGLRSNEADLPVCHASRSAQFRDGWLNGRDARDTNPTPPGRMIRACSTYALRKDARQ